ncbi:MAG TPA: hypothetical protein VFJ15_04315 [Oleiagrimonas sp.]|nr:hypothetical protein [Oleiagrimonas sp.]
MTATPAAGNGHWARPYWHASGEDAMLLFFVFGRFSGDTNEIGNALKLPDGIQLTRYAHATLRNWEGYPLTGALGDVFQAEVPQTLTAARNTPDVLRLAGEIRDPSDLDYLRDTLNALTRLFEAGGVAVVDPQTSGLLDRDTWHRRFLAGTATTMRQHVLVLCDADPDDASSQWIHTRGMRKFARPDISLTRVPGSDINQAGALCEQLVDMLALGGQFADGQSLPVDGLAGPLVAQPGGHKDDPRFYNTHVELRWPT